jgi:hypothetical protein
LNSNSTDTSARTKPHASDRLRATPGQWLEISRHSTCNSAKVTASKIRNGIAGACWCPRGSFQTHWEADGSQFVLYGRYVGDAR